MDIDSLAILHEENAISDEEFLLLSDLKSGNLYLPHNKYERFILDDMENDECKANSIALSLSSSAFSRFFLIIIILFSFCFRKQRIQFL